MEIKIRDIEPYAVKKVDELARKKNLSRNAFLKNQIESLAIMGDLQEIEARYEQLTESLAAVIAENTNAFEKILFELEKR